MALTGTAFVMLVALLALGGFVAAVKLWPHLSGTGPRTILGRVGLLVGVNLLVLLTAAAQLNHMYLFYADWTDLFGALGHNPTVTTSAGGSAAAAASGATYAALTTPGRWPPLPPGTGPNNRILHFEVRGPVSGVRAEVAVELPLAYFNKTQPDRLFPVIEAFHGYPGEPDQWIDTMGLGSHLEPLVAKRVISDALIVAPSWEVPADRDTECNNGTPPAPKVETFLTVDVPRWVVHTFRASPKRTSWATIGLSAGGYCAAMAAMLHPQQYAAAIVLGGYFRPWFFRHAWHPYTSRSPLDRRYDLVRLAHDDPPPVAIWMETSHSDSTSFPSSNAFLKAARAPLSVTAEVLSHAGHRVGLWKGMLNTVLTWLGTNVPGFAPVR